MPYPSAPARLRQGGSCFAIQSTAGEALPYLSEQRDEFTVSPADVPIPIHNNDSNPDLRRLALGHANRLVFYSPLSGVVARRSCSPLLSCRQIGVDPETYLEDLLARVSTTPASQLASQIPWALE